MIEQEGYIEKIIYRNVDNGYTVFELGEEIVCTGSFPFISEGEYIVVRGNKIQHSVYGDQIKVESYEIKEPEDILAVQRYLASGAISGIRAGLAKRIIDQFGEDTFRIMEYEPERLSEVKGISDKKARSIGEQFTEKKEMRNALIYLQGFGISNHLAVKIFNQYHDELYVIIKHNPYQLAEDIYGMGFKMADEIARKAGLEIDSVYRIRSGIQYVLVLAGNVGHVYLPEELLVQNAVEILGVDLKAIEEEIVRMGADKQIIIKEEKGERRVYLLSMYHSELSAARMLLDLNVRTGVLPERLETILKNVEKREKIELDEHQLLAVREAIMSGLLVITGGPGTGKTTTINTIIHALEEEGLEILLAAPTGRAAKRMSETTGRTAQTIHRLLEYNGGISEEEKNDSKSQGGLKQQGESFERNEWNPLEADVVIIDEMSMVDLMLCYHLLKAIPIGTRVIFVGDVNQLPSVGAGNVLRDIIDSHCCNVVKLTKIFRQAAKSDIVVNAHRIINAESEEDISSLKLDNKSEDFFCLEKEDSHSIMEVVLWLVRDKMPGYVKCHPFDVQVLTPMKKGELGVVRCNQILQKYLNPERPGKPQMEAHDTLFRQGDKVMQIKNNYQIEWKIRGAGNIVISEGTGIFNGDCGTIKEINTFSKEITVEFDERREVIYSISALDELELAYAITIHKSQGSEYPAIVIPLLGGPRMLMNRNLLYT
ncbi:MAG: ATP-dependent RecD-like DNA helicase, partial [Lachnoclostridium sp.]|nr:ATP-dependent RecD-like DNA helicase [Lachnoclostridium sp.]